MLFYWFRFDRDFWSWYFRPSWNWRCFYSWRFCSRFRERFFYILFFFLLIFFNFNFFRFFFEGLLNNFFLSFLLLLTLWQILRYNIFWWGFRRWRFWTFWNWPTWSLYSCWFRRRFHNWFMLFLFSSLIHFFLLFLNIYVCNLFYWLRNLLFLTCFLRVIFYLLWYNRWWRFYYFIHRLG